MTHSANLKSRIKVKITKRGTYRTSKSLIRLDPIISIKSSKKISELKIRGFNLSLIKGGKIGIAK
jgi:hypothetical protein